MKRLTKLSNNKEFYITEDIEGKLVNDGYYGDAIEKLAKFENVYDHLIGRKNLIPKELETLRNEGKNKTYKFKELLAEKMMNEMLLNKLIDQGLK